MITEIVHTKRPIIIVAIDSKEKYALLDTGASLSIVSEDVTIKGSKYHGRVIGAGGNSLELFYPKNTIIDIRGIRLTNFLVGNIKDVQDSIKRETGIKIDMIIGAPDIKSAEMKIDLYNNVVKLGE